MNKTRGVIVLEEPVSWTRKFVKCVADGTHITLADDSPRPS